MKRFALAVISVFFFQYSAQAAVPTIEREALVALYNSTDGAQWWRNTNWLTGDPCADEWYGITCDENENIKSISLKRNRLRNSIPPDLGSLSQLYSLDLRTNLLEGSIPPELGSLGNLRFLYLSGNYFKNSIPVELGNLGNLRTLSLSSSQLTGSIPAELGNLTNLHFLYLQNNQLSGTLPVELGNITNLELLNLSNNQLNGPVPPDLGSLPKLKSMWLESNELSGVIPAELGNLSNLTVMRLGENEFSGAIPVGLANLSSLEYLDLGGNQLSGQIPADLGSLPMLEFLDLHFNRLSGAIPAELSNLTSLRAMDLYTNQLTGPIPVELSTLPNLGALNLQRNQLTGSIPVELSTLPNLAILNLAHNQLTGSIPVELSNLPGLSELNLESNQLTGPIPAEIGNLSNLRQLNLQDNQLSGSIPAELGELPFLWYIYLANNHLDGSVPAELGNLSNLQALELQGNQLSGLVPETFFELGTLAGRHGLNLRWNAIYTDDAVLDSFLDDLHELDDQRKRDWSITQTIAPANVSVTEVSENSITLGWEPIEYDEGEGGYRVWYGTSPGGPYMDGGITANKGSTSHTVSSLIPGQAYYLLVTTETESHDDNSNTVISDRSSEVFTQTATAAWPTGIKATDGTYLDLVRVTFNPVTDATVYRVFRCLDMGQTCGSPIGYPTTGSFDDRNVVPGTVYYYRVRACVTNDCGKFSPANTGFASVQLPQPTGIQASDGTHEDRVEVAWNAVEGASVYRVFRCLDKDQTCGSPIGYPNGTGFDDRKGDPGTVYYYRAKACNTQHCSKFSAANTGSRIDTPALEQDVINAFLLPGQQVPIPTLNDWGKWLLTLMVLGFGLVLLNRQYQQSLETRG